MSVKYLFNIYPKVTVYENQLHNEYNKTLITYLNNKMASYSFENSDIDLHINNHISIFAHGTTRGGKHHIYGKNFNTFSSTVDTLVYLESLQSNWDIPLNVLIFCCHADAIINDKHNYKFLKSGSTLSTYTSGKINIKKNYQLMTSIIQYSNNNKFLDVFFGALTPTGKDFKNLYVCNMEGKKNILKFSLSKSSESLNKSSIIEKEIVYTKAFIGHMETIMLCDYHDYTNQAQEATDYLKEKLLTLTNVKSMMIAAEYGYCDVVKEQIEQGVDISQARYDGTTPMMIAAEWGHCDVVKELIAQGGNISQARHDGTTPMIIAAEWGHYDVVKELIAQGGNISQARHDGTTPMIIAAEWGHYDVVKELIAQGGNISQARHDGTTAMMIAAEWGHYDVVKELIAQGGNISQARHDGTTPMMIAAKYYHFNIVIELLAHYTYNYFYSDDNLHFDL